MSTEFEDFKRRASHVINVAFGGEHHVQKLEWFDSQYPRCKLRTFELATWDHDEMTRLVVAAHDQCLRVAVQPAMRYLRVFITARVRTHPMHEISMTHPTLEDHVAYIRHQMSREEFLRRLAEQNP